MHSVGEEVQVPSKSALGKVALGVEDETVQAVLHQTEDQEPRYGR